MLLVNDIEEYANNTPDKDYVAIQIRVGGKKYIKILEFTPDDLLASTLKLAVEQIQTENGLLLLKSINLY